MIWAHSNSFIRFSDYEGPTESKSPSWPFHSLVRVLRTSSILLAKISINLQTEPRGIIRD